MHYSTENFSTALEYFHKALEASEIADYPDRFRLYLRISDCHRKRGTFAEAQRYLEAARGLLPEGANEECLGKIEYREAYTLLWQGNYEEALKLGFRAYRRLKHSGEHGEVAYIQLLVANCYQRLGLIGEAEEFFADALSSYRRVDDRMGIAYVYNSLGLLHKNACRWNRAVASISKSLDIAKSLGLTQHLIRANINLGVVYAKLRNFPDAIAAFKTAANTAERFGDQYRLTKALLMLGRTYVKSGEGAKAEKHLVRAQAMAGEYGYARESALADEYLGELMLSRGNYAAAVVNLTSALEKGRKLAPDGDVVAESLQQIAGVELQQNRLQDAVRDADEGIEIANSCGEFYELGFLYRTRGLALARMGRADEAAKNLQTSVEKFNEFENPYEKAISQQLLARHFIRHRTEPALLKAKQVLAESIVEFGKIDDGRQQILSQILLATVERRLGNLDEALLAIYEADRLVEEEGKEKYRKALVALRNGIETQMTRATTRVLNNFSVLGDIQNGARSRDQLVKGLGSTLHLILEKLGSTAGFIAIPGVKSKSLEVVARERFTRKDSQAILAWHTGRAERNATAGAGLVMADLTGKPETSSLRAKLAHPSGRLLLQGLGFEGENLGLLCIHQAKEATRPSFGQDALHFVGAYSSLISLSIYEIVRSERRSQSKTRTAASKGFESILTENKDMIKLLNLCERVAHSDATVLLQGETGTGKGLIAYAIHLLSERRERKFVHVNCAALPEQLLESELFGHVRGSFTGAFADKDGLLYEAHGGTIFLDEIGKTSLAMQGKLLQFLDTGKVRKVGANELAPVDVRVICASKTNLLKMCHEARFLEDFFYRINDFPLTVPPLRDRVEDIPLLMYHYLDKYSREMNKALEGVTDEFLQKLESYRWPGNVRELEKVVKRAIILANDGERLSVEHLAPEVAEAGPAPVEGEEDSRTLTLRERIEQIEQAAILQALKRFEWNKSQTAIYLGISYPNLLSKIKRYNIQ